MSSRSRGAGDGVCIAAIHGLLARDFMQRHFIGFLAEAGYPDARVYPYLRPVSAQADQIEARLEGRALVLVGFSQGGFQALRLAREFSRRGRTVDLLVTIAAGGMGRWLPWQWGFDPRQVPSNVEHALNFFAVGDRLGTDARYTRNLARHQRTNGRIENIGFAAAEDIAHAELLRCYPEQRVHPKVREHLLQRLLDELAAICANGGYRATGR